MNPFKILKNMGVRYTFFRLWYEFKIRTRLQKIQYPTNITPSGKIALDKWQNDRPNFFFKGRISVKEKGLPLELKSALKNSTDNIKKNRIRFFSGDSFDLGKNYNWLTNPLTGFEYNKEEHWTQINDLDVEAGDIKFVWEKSRFSYLYTVLRNDQFNNTDNSQFVLSEIESWIDGNKMNCGPNFKCSQEIALRVLNWIFFLHYYSDSSALDNELFQKIMDSIYGQIIHVEKNINFSRIAVRNNHAICESLGLYVVGTLCPWFKEAVRWKAKGKKYLEEEGLYQIYEDGSYIQHSFNYQRVVTQLFSWALAIADLNGDSFSERLISRLSQMRHFLVEMCNKENGMLPNHGPNDGALFFPMNSCDYRDFRGQINLLSYLIDKSVPYSSDNIFLEDLRWFGIDEVMFKEYKNSNRLFSEFPVGGYYSFRAPDTFSFIRCASYKNRPYQADNLHLDIWYKGVNLLRDNGTYLYNGEEGLVNYFSGTGAHNTVMVGNSDQMKKAGRFVWYDWSSAMVAEIDELDNFLLFTGKISAFKHVRSGITHERIVKFYKNETLWEIEDLITGVEKEISQIWNISPEFKSLGFSIESVDGNGDSLKEEVRDVYYSNTYGVKESAEALVFKTETLKFKTKIFKR